MILNGSPPHFRGTNLEGKNLDLCLLECFPFVGGFFIEKPVSAMRPEESGISKVKESLREWSEKTGGIVGVAYNLRYLKGQYIKCRCVFGFSLTSFLLYLNWISLSTSCSKDSVSPSPSRDSHFVLASHKLTDFLPISSLQFICYSSIISSNSLSPMLISARYYMAYEHAVKLSWWNKSISCGPVVEQATHFLDLLSYFGGEVDRESISCQTVEWDENPGKLSKIGFNEEENIKEEDRIPRATSSIWKFENGGIGQLNHVVGLHGEFETMIFRGLGVEASEKIKWKLS